MTRAPADIIHELLGFLHLNEGAYDERYDDIKRVEAEAREFLEQRPPIEEFRVLRPRNKNDSWSQDTYGGPFRSMEEARSHINRHTEWMPEAWREETLRQTRVEVREVGRWKEVSPNLWWLNG